MKVRFSPSTLLAAAVTLVASSLLCQGAALNGDPYIHDPATVTFCDGKWYTYGTGGGGLVSDDGWTWKSGPTRPGGGAAPDVLKIGNRYLMAYGATGGGLGGGHTGRILTMWNDTLDQSAPNFKWSAATVVASSDGIEDCDAIDPSLMMDADGKLWLSYGTFFGFIRVVELDPKTGLRVEGNQAVNIAIDCEGTELAYRDGWYYLFGTHGTCCNGATSTYNIQVGRSKKVTGPYLDAMGYDMIKGGGKLLVAASGRFIGAGHPGRIFETDGVEKMSMHYEADLDRSGRSVVDVRPLYWKDGWPVVGDNIQKETTFTIASTGKPLQPAGETNDPGSPRQFTIAPAPDAGGYLGMPYMKITSRGGALALDANKQLITVPTFTGTAEQLWRLDQLTDGTWRIIPKSADTRDNNTMALTASGSVTTLAKYDFKNPAQHWDLKDPAANAPLKEGTYEIQSARSGFALELAVTGTPIGGGGRGGGFGRGGGGGPVTPVQLPDPAQVASAWPTTNIDLRIGDYMLAAHQKWTLSPIPGGDPATPYYKITIAGTSRALAATADKDVTVVAEFSGKPEEQWRIEKLEDGSCRVTPRQVPNSTDSLVLTAVGASTPSLSKFDPKSDKSKWNFKQP